jgi:hypothetical protein
VPILAIEPKAVNTVLEVFSAELEAKGRQAGGLTAWKADRAGGAGYGQGLMA